MIKSISSKMWIQTGDEFIGPVPCVVDNDELLSQPELPADCLSDKASIIFSGEASFSFSADADITKWDQFINRSLVGMS